MENLYTENSIRTVSGLYVNVFDPDPSTIIIEDIAHALCNMPRFGGHLHHFYSVAQHSLVCAHFASEKNKKAALMHDSSEAYLIDVPKPIKIHLTNYKKIEDKLMGVLSEKFQFEYPLCKEIKEIDEFVLHLEWEQLMLEKNEVKHQIPSKFLDNWKGFRKMFLDEFNHLKNKQV